ncbi:helix-turn-helix domain-containing protein [Streptomyces mutabilis]|uniref:hypothetical protein n=1 Tax=Streptomyces mutabilis TaxID=67332 RepID=UPI000AEA5668|nr:hypothetical protein [Streptomyces mutabilis]
MMAHEAFHHYSHGTSGARILACLDITEGLSPAHLKQATALHRTTVARRLDKLVADDLVRESEGLYYLVRGLAGPAPLQPDERLLDRAAEQQGTTGLGVRRRQRHARNRANYQRWISERATRPRPVRPYPVLVPEGAIDPDTGELLDEGWRGWDTSAPFRPTWLAPGAHLVSNRPSDSVEAACA